MKKQRYLHCSRCGAVGDMKDVRSVSGWQVLPSAVCRCCIDAEMALRGPEIKPTTSPVVFVERSSFFGKVIVTMDVRTQ